MNTEPIRTVIAWTGGCRPAKPSATSREQAQLRKQLFREQVAAWISYWGDSPSADVFRTYFRRASYDAHATFRA